MPTFSDSKNHFASFNVHVYSVEPSLPAVSMWDRVSEAFIFTDPIAFSSQDPEALYLADIDMMRDPSYEPTKYVFLRQLFLGM